MLALMAGTVGVGCKTPEQRYQTLSFFFDGVPRPGETEESAEAVRKKRRDPHAFEGSAHPKKDGWACKRCHNQFDSNRLKAPPEKLCPTCHKRDTFPKGKMHGPVGVKHCVPCHDPHRSGQPALLKKPVPDLCRHCHDDKAAFDQHIEDQGAECLRCHNPHASVRDHLLRPELKAR